MVKIKFIVGSTRPNRFGQTAAEWVYAQAGVRKDAQFELVDLKEINLPFLDEPQSPMMGNYANAHTKKWSKILDEADGFVWITPEYNHSTSAAMKNAIDFAYREWNDKPVAMVGYGVEAGGARAIEHLRQIAAQVKMFDIASHVLFPFYWNHQDEQGNFSPEGKDKEVHAMLDELVFWATQMKRARMEKVKQ